MGTSLNEVFFALPPPPDVVRQAIDLYLRDSIYKTVFNVLPGAPLNRTVAYLKCTPLDADLFKDFDEVFIWTLLIKASSKKVPAIESRDSLRDGKYIHEVGTLNRPRQFVFPALILLASLTTLDAILYFVVGSENIAMKMFHISRKVASANCIGNAILTESKIVHLCNRGCTRSPTVGSVNSGSSICAVDNAIHFDEAKANASCVFIS